MTNVFKPDGGTVRDPLNFMVRVYEAIVELQARTTTPFVFLGSRTADPGPPPAGKVYVYTINGSAYMRTATQQTLVAT